jgi:hypothetical protein
MRAFDDQELLPENAQREVLIAKLAELEQLSDPILRPEKTKW